jgi:hypothetical protein
MVHEIEELAPKLEIGALGQPEIAADRGVQIDQAGAERQADIQRRSTRYIQVQAAVLVFLETVGRGLDGVISGGSRSKR